MELLLKWVLMATVQLAATMSPGPAFVIAVRNAMIYDRKTAVSTAFGLSLGVAAHVGFVLVGLAFLIAQSLFLYNFIKYAGAAYLLYIGIKAIRSAKKAQNDADKDHLNITVEDEPKVTRMSIPQAIMTGFLTNLLNPKAVIFFTAVYSQFITPDTPFFMHLLYGATSMVIEFTWFALLGLVLTNPRLKMMFSKVMQWVERVCGGFMIALGLKLALSK